MPGVDVLIKGDTVIDSFLHAAPPGGYRLRPRNMVRIGLIDSAAARKWSTPRNIDAPSVVDLNTHYDRQAFRDCIHDVGVARA